MTYWSSRERYETPQPESRFTVEPLGYRPNQAPSALLPPKCRALPTVFAPAERLKGVIVACKAAQCVSANQTPRGEALRLAIVGAACTRQVSTERGLSAERGLDYARPVVAVFV